MKPSLNFCQLISKSYAFNSEVYERSISWRLAWEAYQINYIGKYPNLTIKIPKKIHQIWLGGELPQEYCKFAESWKKHHPDWEYNLWTDCNIRGLEITKPRIFNNATSPAMKSDILRYEILRQFGGLYVDTDFECLKPFDDLLYLDFFTGISYDSVFQLYNGLIASVPYHPIINLAVHSMNNFYSGNKGSKILEVTGANHFTRCFKLMSSCSNEDIVAFPMDFFYPFPNNMRDKDDPYKYVQDFSYAIHHWAVSWSKKKI